MIDADNLERSKAIQQRTGRTFHLATRLLPARIRHATYVMYAFFRIADDVVDDPNPPPAERQLAELERIREAALGDREPTDPVLQAFVTVRDRYDIPDREIDEFVDAMARDVSTDRYETHDELSGYLRGSSVAVANMMLCVMDPDDREAARPHAKALAEALQLTNFLRDVREDVCEYDRIYLPRSRREAFGVSETQIANWSIRPSSKRSCGTNWRERNGDTRPASTGSPTSQRAVSSPCYWPPCSTRITIERSVHRGVTSSPNGPHSACRDGCTSPRRPGGTGDEPTTRAPRSTRRVRYQPVMAETGR